MTLAFAATCGALALPSTASAARSGVTIHLRVADEFKGFVFSPKPRQCADGRTVKLFRQEGKRQNPKRDVKVAKTQASRRGSGKYMWIVDLRHPRPGNYYATVAATAGCQADNSKTIHLAGRPNTKITGVHVDHRSVSFHYRVVGGIAPYLVRCKLDDQPYRTCKEYRKSYRKLSRGRHVFKVRAVGHDGKRDRTPAKRRFHVPS